MKVKDEKEAVKAENSKVSSIAPEQPKVGVDEDRIPYQHLNTRAPSLPRSIKLSLTRDHTPLPRKKKDRNRK